MIRVLVFFLWVISSTCYSSDDMIKMVSYNVKMLPKICNALSEKNQISQQNRLNYLIEFLKKESFDVVNLQEVFDPKAVELLKEALAKQYPYCIKPSKKGIGFSNGLMVLSKFPMDNIKTIYFQKLKFFDFFVSKGAISYHILIQNQNLGIINTHLQSDYNPLTASNTRINQLKDIHLLMSSNKSTSSFILAGDFNFQKQSKEYQFLSELSLIDPIPSKTFKTFCGMKNNNDSNAIQLDYFFTNQTFIANFDTWIKILDGKNKEIHISDHRPLVLECSPTKLLSEF